MQSLSEVATQLYRSWKDLCAQSGVQILLMHNQCSEHTAARQKQLLTQKVTLVQLCFQLSTRQEGVLLIDDQINIIKPGLFFTTVHIIPVLSTYL